MFLSLQTLQSSTVSSGNCTTKYCKLPTLRIKAATILIQLIPHTTFHEFYELFYKGVLLI